MKRFSTMAAILVLGLFTAPVATQAQQGRLDSLFRNRDTTAVMDSLLAGFDEYLDSLLHRKSFFMVNVGVGTGFFSFENKNSFFFSTQKKLIITPAIAYYHRSGFGLSATAFALSDHGLSLYQWSFSPSYDLLKKKYSTGIAYTRYLSRDSLDFYTTPIKNELFAYFTYKNWWVRPSVSFSYGWGSRTQYDKERAQRLAVLLSQSDNYYVIVKNEESVRDFSMTLSLRKDIDWFNVISGEDNITFTPAILVNFGTQNFGFNTSYSYSHNAPELLPNSLPSNNEITSSAEFAPQSTTLLLRGSYLKGKFLLQPQLLLDYGLQSSDKSLRTVFSITAAVTF